MSEPTKLDQVMAEAFSANDQPMLDYVAMKFRILALEAALRPFAALNLGPQGYCSLPLTDHVAKARALLHDSQPKEGEVG